jgi:ribosomal protein L21
MYAVIATGGKQYKVTKGETLRDRKDRQCVDGC